MAGRPAARTLNRRFRLNDFVAGIARLLMWLIATAAGLVLFASLLLATLVLAAAWGLRAGWARLTGRPVNPWVMRMDPRTGFGTVFRSARWSATARSGPVAPDEAGSAAAPSRRGGVLPGAQEVTDVEARQVR
jgi:hypothetical protein